MGLGNAAGQSQTDAEPLRLGRMKWIENVLKNFWRDTVAGVFDRQFGQAFRIH